MGFSNESSARDLIARFIQSVGAHDGAGIVPFVSAWPRIVGTDLAAHTKVMDIKNGTVLVGVDHPGWMQRIHLEQRRIIAVIRREFPSLGVRYLHFSIVSPGELDAVQPASISSLPGDRDPDASAVHKQQDSLGNSESVTSDPAADEAFQKHLKGLEQALRHRESEKNTKSSSSQSSSDKRYK